jgi:hypothetical protein
MATERAKITGESVFRFSGEVLVELTGRTPDGEFLTVSYEFSRDDDIVEPRGEVRQDHVAAVRGALVEAGYSPVDLP